MKAMNIIIKIMAALAAVAGVVYVVATYGDKIVAWAKKLLGCGCECECAEEAEEAAEEVAEEIAEETEESAEEVVEASEADFEG